MELIARLIIGIVAFCAATTAAIYSSMIEARMIDEINRKKSEGDLISQFWFTAQKHARIRKEYRQLYPDGKLLTYLWTATAVVFTGFVVVAVCLGIIP
jgi:hypothetical protein